jgi:thiamine-phosphate pyrophosphorylase
MPSDRWGFYFITDSKLTNQSVAGDVKDALRGGAKVVQYREKGKSRSEMEDEAREILMLCRRVGAELIVNDDPKLALAVGADGVHIGQGDAPLNETRKALPGRIVGVSCSTADEATSAEMGGADYIAASPVFSTSTKKDIGRPIGLDGLRALRVATNLPIVAIGGIKISNVREVVLAGADSICAISATVGRPDIASAVEEFETHIRAAHEERARIIAKTR